MAQAERRGKEGRTSSRTQVEVERMGGQHFSNGSGRGERMGGQDFSKGLDREERIGGQDFFNGSQFPFSNIFDGDGFLTK